MLSRSVFPLGSCNSYHHLELLSESPHRTHLPAAIVLHNKSLAVPGYMNITCAFTLVDALCGSVSISLREAAQAVCVSERGRRILAAAYVGMTHVGVTCGTCHVFHMSCAYNLAAQLITCMSISTGCGIRCQ
jgi:hypothetical protein